MKVKTNFKEMYLVDKFLYNKISNSSQTFNNLSSKFNVINRVPPPNESPSHPESSSKEDNISIKRDDSDEPTNRIESKQIANVENQEQGNGNNIHPPNNVHDHVHTKAERTYPNQIEQMEIDNPPQQLTHPPNIVHNKAERTYPNQIEQMQLTHPLNNVHDLMPNTHHTKDGRMNNVTHSPSQVSNMDFDISPPNHLPNQCEQTQPPSTLQITFPPSRGSREQGVSSLQLKGIKPLENVRGTEALPQSDMIQPQINLQSPDNECMECVERTPRTYEKYIENGAIPKTKKKYATIYTCTLCNTNFKMKKKLERHIKNMHDAYSQKEKGKKRKNENEHDVRKRVKKNYNQYFEKNYNQDLEN